MGRQTLGIFTIAILILFCIGVLFVGQEYSLSSKFVTVRIEGIRDARLEQNVHDLMKKIPGIETFILDKNAGLCSIRYDSSEINFESIESQFSALGLTITPLTQIDKLNIPPSPDQKLIQIRFSKSNS
ncbi:MAG: hypothetical protein WC957_08575 [Candidatus Neomarinimicrobiota bacterium]|jgi:hypothetical protein